MKLRTAFFLLLVAVCTIPAGAQTLYANCTTVMLWPVGETNVLYGSAGQILQATDNFDMICETTGATTTMPANTEYFNAAFSVTATGGYATAEFPTAPYIRGVYCPPVFRWNPYVAPSAGGSRSASNSGTAYGQNRQFNGIPFCDYVLNACPGCSNGYLNRSIRYCMSQACRGTPAGSPIIVDLSGKGFILTDAQDGVMFDITGTGHPIQMGWTANRAQNAFLALPGPDGLVHGGKQLFGNFTPQPPSATPNGFAALAVYDDNHDGVIDARDAVWKLLRLWIDENHDGISQPEELHTLAELGVNSISLKYKDEPWHDQYGNAFRYRARVNDETTDKWTYDVFFVSLCK
jgi:hypothetical protein